MLCSLNIKNIILIDHLMIEFKQGLCALTGETGAGKSILLDSLGLALGVRAESGLVRKGTEQASVTASFQILPDHSAYKILKDADIECSDDILLMRRTVNNAGKSRAFINDQPVSIGLLRQVGDTLVEIHGQFETQGLLNPQTHRRMLDSYINIDSVLPELWNTWRQEELALNDMKNIAENSSHEEEFLRTSLDDLQSLEPLIGEEYKISQLRERLKHREAVLESLARADHILSAESDPIQSAWAELERISERAGEGVDGAIDALSRASSEMQEAGVIIRNLSTDLQETEYNLEDIDDRLYALRAQARKHACEVDDLLAKQDDLANKLALITSADDCLAAQRRVVGKARNLYIKEAQKISAKRSNVALKLNKLVQAELAPLKLDKAKFVTQVEQMDEIEWSAHGIDRVRFLVSTNPGLAPGAIHKIASGGEMSRFMLALKVVIAQGGSTHSFIFDEVDAGLGGSTADAVGERLSRLATSKQVLVVTHAPQVAARASNHWIVQKSGNDEIITTITSLDTKIERCEEIARMLAGASITPEARAAANKLLENAA